MTNVETGCPYQKGKDTIICEADRLMVPSMEEIRLYCSVDYRKCPYYLAVGWREEDMDAVEAGAGFEFGL